MKKLTLCFLLLLLNIQNSFSQEKKYQSLLWEISGKNLTKKSYMYGSMHVSDKVSYHLSDAFFKHLLAADMVANESDPSTWHEMMHLYNQESDNMLERGFYKKFYQKPIDKNALQNLFMVNDFMMNNLLFRTNNFRSDYQEETYLDMFIYQTGRKFNKRNVGLEDALESMKLMYALDFENIKPDIDRQQKLARLLNGKSVDEVMKDYYRDKNLDMLDSLMVLSSPPVFLEALLYKRNVIMTKSMDSLMQKGSLFAAVGAAHIPGSKGMVELLRARGYIVNPVFSDYTDIGKNQKKQIEQTFIKPKQQDFTSSDQFIQAKLFENIQLQGKTISSPDLSNGSFVQIKRLPIHDFLVKKDKRFNYQSLDSLFYENIPGEIQSKKFSENKNYKLFDIKSKTKTGDFHRYQYYITPLEIISLSLVGKFNYVNMYENIIFDNFKLNFSEKANTRITPNYASFSINMPTYHVVYGDSSIKEQGQLVELYGYDSHNDTYYFCIENVLNDFENLEDTTYELNRIQDEYLIEIDALDTKKTILLEKNKLTSEIRINNQKSFLQTLVKNNRYYLLAAINTEKDMALKYFESFSTKPLVFEETFKTYKDTASLLAIDVPYKHNQKLFLRLSTKEPPLKVSKKTNYFNDFTQDYWIKSETGEKVLLKVHKFHKYFSIKHIDSLVNHYKNRWVTGIKSLEDKTDDDLVVSKITDDIEEVVAIDQISNFYGYNSYYGAKNIGKIKSTWDNLLGFEKDLENNKKRIITDKFYFDEYKKMYVYEGLVTQPNAIQGIKFKYYIKDGITYELRTLVEKDNPTALFLDKIDKNLKPFDSILPFSMYANKLDLFIEHANSKHDSIRYSALNSISELSIDKQDLLKLKQFTRNFKFNKNEKNAILSLYNKIGNINQPEIIDFLKADYKDNIDNGAIQFAILKALANQKSKKAYHAILELLNFDIPISESKYDVYQLFDTFSKDFENSKVLMPEILKYISLNDYHDPIFNFVYQLNENNKITPKQLKKYKDMLLVNAKIEYKRVFAKMSKKEDADYYQSTRTLEITEDLIKYLYLLNKFANQKDVKQFMDKAKSLNVREVNIILAKLDIENHQKINPVLKESLLNDLQTMFTTYLMLSKNDKEDFNLTAQELMESAITIIDDVKHEEEEMAFLFEKRQKVDKNNIVFYFYKLTKNQDNLSNYGYENDPKLLSIGFVLNENGQPILESFYSGLQKTIENEDKLNELAAEVIDEALNQNKPRATSGKMEEYLGMGWEMMY